MVIKTQRLRIIPLSVEQLKTLRDEPEKLETELGLNPSGTVYDEHMTEARNEMSKLCETFPDKYLWYTEWLIILTAENKQIGSIGFKGFPNEDHEIEIGYGIDEPYRQNGYAAEALKHMTEWAFTNDNVYYIQAQVEPDNEASKRVLEKCMYTESGTGEKGLLYELEKPETSYTALYMCIGAGVGTSLGAAFKNIALCICLGLAVGMILGRALDAADKQNRVRKNKNQ